MLRRSAPALLGLFVCLLAAHLSSAAPTFDLDESRIRLSLDEARARFRVEVENGTGREFEARLRVELLDPREGVRARAASDVRLRRGQNALEVALELPYRELLDAERKEFPWYRLRYSVAPAAGAGAPPALEGVVSVSEVTPDLFGLTVISARDARPGSHYAARVRAANPVTQRPVKGVAVEATLTFDGAGDKKTVLKASGATDGDGLLTLDFDVPSPLRAEGDEAELKVRAARGVLLEEARSDVGFEELPRVLLTTDKPLYQPGQTVHMRALAFSQGGRALADEEVTFRVEDEDDSTAFTATLKTSRFGVASADWRVPATTKLGTYTLKLVMDEGKYDIDYGAVIDFRLSRYDLPNFSVTAKADRPYYLGGQRPSVEVRADYLFGQPVRRGRVRVVRQTERRWNYKEQKYETEEEQAVEGELKEGVYVARLNLADEHKELADSGYERYRDLDLVAYVTDPTTNRTEQRRFNVRLTKEPIHLYVVQGRYRQAEGLPLAFYLAASYADGTPAECDVTVYEEGETKRKAGGDGRVHEVTEADRSLVNVRTNRYGVAKVSGPVMRDLRAGGNIPLRFVARDRAGRAGSHRDDFWVGRDTVPELRVETDKSLYAAGETVRVELSSNAESMTVVVDAVSEGRVLYTRTARLAGGRAVLFIPTGPDFAGPVNVSAMSAAPVRDDDDSYSIGARTVVFPRDRELKLDVKLSQKSFRPGEEADAQFAVHTADGRRAAGALGVVVFDKAVEERARTDGESGRGFGFYGSFFDYWYGYSAVAGVTRRDVERLNPASKRPEGFEAVAELLYNNETYYGSHKLATGTDFDREQARVFADLVKPHLRPVREALAARYDATTDYPADEAALVRALAQAGVDLAALRDPWGQPYRPRFSYHREHDRLELYTAGADERPHTDDDFVAASFSWPYFRKSGEALSRAAAEYHRRTGGFVRDFDTLLAESRRVGLDAAALRDRWGQPYRFHFDTRGTYFVVTVESAGPDRTFAARRGDTSSDDFEAWKVQTDYFEESRKAVDAALERNMREGRAFPRTRDELAAVLAKSSLTFGALRDGWGRPAYATFSTTARYGDRVEVETRGPGGVRRSTRPVTQTVRTVSLGSAGPDGREGTGDDFTLAFYTSVASEQTAQDAAPAPAAQVTTFSGGTGAITGTVTDPNGAAIPNATVKARHGLSGVEAGATTNEEGVYLLRNLPAGVYTLTITAAGFVQLNWESITVLSANLTQADATLTVGNMAETVEVMAAGDLQMNTSSQMSVSNSVGVKGAPVLAQPPLSTPRLREFFPETLVWSPELETGRDGTARLNFKLADNITTWKMSVIASTEDGRLGTAEEEFLSFQPFFVEHDPPRVLTEGDEISLPVVLRNYLPKPQGVDVEMKPEHWFTLGGAARQRAQVPAGDAARPTFDFRAVASVTDGKQRVTALGPDASDAIEKPVTVHPDGDERSVTDGTLLTDSGALSVNVPADAVRGSVRGELKVYPNLAAHVLEGVEAIMSRPYGCGEQTISSAYPSVLVLKHHAGLKAGGGEPEVVARARKYARLGYERLLGYRAPGGGFTYWGRGEADLALSAYALRFLTDAGRVGEVDADVIGETRDWLLKKQRADGSWPAHNWGGREDTRQTALTTVFIARVIAATQKEQAAPLKRALAYVAARAEEADEPYLIASLALAASDAGETALVARAASRLRALALAEGGGTYWALETNTPFYGWGLAGRVETTALAVQALNRYCATPNADCGLKTDESAAVVSPSSNPQADIGIQQLIDRGLYFLLRKKDRYGVWYSTQATINVFDALLSVVAARGGPATNAQGEDVAEVFVNGRRAGQLTLPPADRLSAPLMLDLTPFLGAGGNRVELRRRGQATPAQAQLVTTFYVPWGARAGAESTEGGDPTKRSPASALKLSVAYDRTEAGITQEVTCSVAAERVGHMGYGMLLAEVGLPPGADVDRASLERAMAESGWSLGSYDVLPDRLVVYLWPQGGGTRFQFKFRPRYGLNALTAPSQLYDYYNPEARTVVPPTRFVVR